MSTTASITKYIDKKAINKTIAADLLPRLTIRDTLFGGTSGRQLPTSTFTLEDLSQGLENYPLSKSGYHSVGGELDTYTKHEPLEFKLNTQIDASDALTMAYLSGMSAGKAINDKIARRLIRVKNGINLSIEALLAIQLKSAGGSYFFRTQGGTAYTAYTVPAFGLSKQTSGMTGSWSGSSKTIADIKLDLAKEEAVFKKNGYYGKMKVYVGAEVYGTVLSMLPSIPAEMARFGAYEKSDGVHNIIALGKYEIIEVVGEYADAGGSPTDYVPTKSISCVMESGGHEIMYLAVANIKAGFKAEKMWYHSEETKSGDALETWIHSRPMVFINQAATTYTADILT